MDKVLVTGGTGFIGYHLVRKLLDEGYDVTVVDNMFRSHIDQDFSDLLDYVKFITMDLCNPEELEKLKDYYRYVFHLAAINGVKYAENIPDVVLKTNLLSTINILEWCRQHKPESFVFASSSEVYSSAMGWEQFQVPTNESVPLTISDPFIPRLSYAGSKIAGELLSLNYAQQHGFKSRIVRFHNIYGPRMGYDHVIPQVITRILNKENPLKVYGADQTRAFCYVTDAVRATYQIAVDTQKEHLVINIGNSQEEIKIRELYRKILKMTSYSPELDEQRAPLGSVDRRCPDTNLLSQLTDYVPKVSLDQGLKLTYEWYKNHDKGQR